MGAARSSQSTSGFTRSAAVCLLVAQLLLWTFTRHTAYCVTLIFKDKRGDPGDASLTSEPQCVPLGSLL